MNTHADKTLENKSQTVTNRLPKLQSKSESTFQFVDNRPEAIAQRKLQEAISNSPRVQQLKAYHEMANNSPQVSQLRALQDRANNSPQFSQTAQLQAMADNYSAQKQQPIQKKKNNTGLPDNLKTGMENLSGMSLDGVNVHRNSDKPAQLQAHAYAQGTDIHLGPGQEKHLPHEAWHVVQQKQGRVQPTMQMKGKVNVNDDAGLEKEADVMGAKAMQMKANSVLPNSITAVGHSSTVQRVDMDEKQKMNLHLLSIQSVQSTKILHEIMAEIASKTEGTVKKSKSREALEKSPGNEIKKAAKDVKGADSAINKTDRDYGGDTSRLIDMTRGSIIYKTFKDLVDGFKLVEKRVKIISGKDKFDPKNAQLGYSDVNLTIKLDTGHIAELQLHLESILKAKDEGVLIDGIKTRSGHDVYKDYGAREGILRGKNKDIAKGEMDKIIKEDPELIKLQEESERIYKQAKIDGNMDPETGLLQELINEIKKRDEDDDKINEYTNMFDGTNKRRSEFADKAGNLHQSGVKK